MAGQGDDPTLTEAIMVSTSRVIHNERVRYTVGAWANTPNGIKRVWAGTSCGQASIRQVLVLDIEL
ncbi:hypothetical protein VCV18_010565 [Metarhizium anisopliae]